MGRLDPEARMTIRALSSRGATRSEVARLLGVTKGAVRYHFRRMASGTADGRSRQKPEVLGLWIEQTEGAKFWLRVMNGLKDRGVQDILIAVVDGLKGFPGAIAAVFPKTQVQAEDASASV